MSSIIIGICGGSTSGKTTVSEALKPYFKNCTLINFDDFFMGKNKIKKEISNWEDPALYRMEELGNVLAALKKNESITIEANSREAKKAGIAYKTLEPSNYIIVEGFLIYYTEKCRKNIYIKVFLEISDKEIIRRRSQRVKNGGGDYSKTYIENTLIEEHHKNVLPQKNYADFVVNAEQNPEIVVQDITGHLKKVHVL